jgi:hypothetical protein
MISIGTLANILWIIKDKTFFNSIAGCTGMNNVLALCYSVILSDKYF